MLLATHVQMLNFFVCIEGINNAKKNVVISFLALIASVSRVVAFTYIIHIHI